MTSSIAQPILPSYRALHATAVILDRTSSDARLVVSGPDRIEWLQGLLTNDIAALAPGGGCYAAYLTPQGRMIGDMRVLHLGETVLLDVVADAREALLSRLDQFIIMEDVSVSDASGTLACVSVAGPQAAAVLARHVAVEAAALDALGEHHHVPVVVAGAPGVCAASRELGVPGWDIYVAPDAAGLLRQALLESGVEPLSAETAVVARIEAGRPRFGVDMDADTIPLEAGIEPRAISLTKGCYVGQEVIIRVLHRGKGRVARRLCWVVSSDMHGESPSAAGWHPGAALHLNGKTVGRLTSVCWSPARQRLLAIGLVHREAFEPGTTVLVETGTSEVLDEATVEALPQ
jgi:tRNA-modifying protein YgfZ